MRRNHTSSALHESSFLECLPDIMFLELTLVLLVNFLDLIHVGVIDDLFVRALSFNTAFL